MSDLSQSIEISGGIFALMIATQYGNRSYNWHRMLLPLVSVLYFGAKYLTSAPTGSNEVMLYSVGIAAGVLLGGVAAAVTRVGRNVDTGKIMTQSGLAFVGIWFASMALRVAFVWGMEDVTPFRNHVGKLMFTHQIGADAIAPFFVLMAFAMVLSRMAVVGYRAYQVSHAPISAAPISAAPISAAPIATTSYSEGVTMPRVNA